jgi:hypothetical protein
MTKKPTDLDIFNFYSFFLQCLRAPHSTEMESILRKKYNGLSAEGFIFESDVFRTIVDQWQRKNSFKKNPLTETVCLSLIQNLKTHLDSGPLKNLLRAWLEFAGLPEDHFIIGKINRAPEPSCWITIDNIENLGDLSMLIEFLQGQSRRYAGRHIVIL